MTFRVEKQNFLNDQQKDVKQEIMEGLIKSMLDPLQKNISLFDNQQSTDLLISCLIMFNREMILSFIASSELLNKEDLQIPFIDSLLNTIKGSILKKIAICKIGMQ